ncbi:MAG: hypothetical protein JWO20_3329 [Candidatus Angelobacter sp.]|jgi:hypothetical protein|nr:hypothetical protein [Candidatus Angelobacter sp.]
MSPQNLPLQRKHPKTFSVSSVLSVVKAFAFPLLKSSVPLHVGIHWSFI